MKSRAKAPRDKGRVELERDVLQAIRDHVRAAYPEEACGGLLGRALDTRRARVTAAQALTNSRAEERGRRYLIGPDDVLKLERDAEKAGLEVVGYYHSHPDSPPIPSDFDKENALPWYIYLILSVRGGETRDIGAWRLSDDRGEFEPIEIRDGDM